MLPGEHPRLAFFDVTLTDAIESPPWGTGHRFAPGVERWESTPSRWEPVLGPPVYEKTARHLVERLLVHHDDPKTHLLVAFEQNGRHVQLAFLKTESGADDLLQLSNCRDPRWWSRPKPPPEPTAWSRLMGPDLL